MKLAYVEMCGFRGFREKVRIEFGGGFTVISGRNGVGKSTICDAIEYAVLGELGKYTIENAAKESVSDYVWWRGDGTPTAHYVVAGFTDEDGQPFTITRTRESGADKSVAEIELALCYGAVPDDALRQLCKTAIIRDEWIAALSLDLSETQRFELVRAALGSIEGADLGARAKAVVTVAEGNLQRVEQAYNEARAHLQTALVEHSQASDSAARSDDVSAAMAILDAAVPAEAGDLAQRLDTARRDLPSRRQRLEGMGLAVYEGREVITHQRELRSVEATEARRRASEAVSAARARLEHAQGAIANAEGALEVVEGASQIAASLAALIAHGGQLGLHDGHCPLCAAQRTASEYQQGLDAAKARIETLAAGVNAARDVLADARIAAVMPARELADAEHVWALHLQALDVLEQREKAHVEIFARYGLDMAYVIDPDGLEAELSRERNMLIDVERALNALEASRAIGRLAAVDARVASLRDVADRSAEALAHRQAAVAKAKSLEKSVRRSAGEIIDERLALISPLLNELYQRLRPHSDWRSIDYSIRGDVRRLLSLKVGNDLNPQFVFSSGQRRAAGLAFLLSVHLARSWTKWSTLLLDDPVQHIDDFRALHLVEVLAAFRQGGRQIVCAVEDEALADLLCRRLLSTSEAGGRRYIIDTGPDGSAGVLEAADIQPLPQGVLRNISSSTKMAG